MIVLDTTLLSHLFRRSGRASTPAPEASRLRKLMDKQVPLALPGIVLQELMAGFRTAEARARLEADVQGLRVLLADRATHVAAALVYTTCREHGVAAGHVDCLIAAHTMHVDGELFTLDDDFKHIAKHTALRLLE